MFVCLFLFLFCFGCFHFYLFCLLISISFVCLTSFENRRTSGFSMPVNKCDFNRENRTNLNYNWPSTRNQDNNYYAWYEIRKKRKEKKINWCRRTSRVWTRERLKKNRKQKIITFFIFLHIRSIISISRGKKAKNPQNCYYLCALSLGSLWISWSFIRPINYHQITNWPSKCRSILIREEWQCVMLGAIS